MGRPGAAEERKKIACELGAIQRHPAVEIGVTEERLVSSLHAVVWTDQTMPNSSRIYLV
jgi:hypothetical protein